MCEETPLSSLRNLLTAIALCSLGLSACTTTENKLTQSGATQKAEASAPETKSGVDALIAGYAASYKVPEALVRRVVARESRFNPSARNGALWGLMQIRHDTARVMGYSGPARGLLDAETNLKYGVKYLAGAYLVAGGNEAQAVRLYSRGYYYDAKRKGLLEETGLKPQAFTAEPPMSAAIPLPMQAPRENISVPAATNQ
ncbi:lytic transglycosylase domain-containing protein [Phyllobacterium salinisoli]|uniref:Lytic transglycosylase domain-containing protein n=1 Tax=Phyllobacterium salinisoli TaxID=1899321 RepID=A0A368K6D9_9HYPH|nr:lytic transglycosylase domain-containing protein [Phyllobacterium salinisoli]